MPVVSWILAAALAAQPVAGTKPLPAAVQKAVREVDALCRDSGGKPGRSPGLVRQADLNGDGLVDYVLDVGVYDCQGAASAVTNGQSGSGATIFVGAPGGIANQAWTGSVFGVAIDAPPKKPRVWVDVAGLDCGQKNAARVTMAELDACTRPLDWDPAKKRFVFAPLNQKRTIK